MVAQQTANLSGFVARRGSSPLSSVCVVEKVDTKKKTRPITFLRGNVSIYVVKNQGATPDSTMQGVNPCRTWPCSSSVRAACLISRV